MLLLLLPPPPLSEVEEAACQNKVYKSLGRTLDAVTALGDAGFSFGGQSQDWFPPPLRSSFLPTTF